MKYTSLFTTLALSLATPAYAMHNDMLARLKEPMEKLKQHANDGAYLRSASTTLEDSIKIYQSLSAQEQNLYMQKQLEHIQKNLIECKNMLNEMRHETIHNEADNRKFWFFHPGAQDDVEDDEPEIDEEKLAQEIHDDIAKIHQLFTMDIISNDALETNLSDVTHSLENLIDDEGN